MRQIAPIGLAILMLSAGCAQQADDVPVPRPEPLLGMNLGGGLSSYIISSHLQTGWARYLETVPATRLLDGIGNWTTGQKISRPEDAERLLGTLSDYGIGAFRIEIGWGSTVYREDLSQPMALTPAADAKVRAIMRASRKHGFRLVMLLNAHQGQPCATLSTKARFLEDASEGSREALLLIDQPEIIRPGYSGISGLTEYCAAEGLFSAVEPVPGADAKAYRVTLTKPLPKRFAADAEVDLATLQYRPFGDPATEDETYDGWRQYADLISGIAREEGVEANRIDFEVWNEMTFGTWFLSIGRYDPSIEGDYDPNRMIQTAAEAIRRKYPAGTRIINGFSNTSFFFGGFWHGIGTGYATGESYHPYGNQWRTYPAAAEAKPDPLLQAFRNVDGFVPAYETFFPEHTGNYITSHDLIPLMQPEMRETLVTEGKAPEGWTRYMTENGLFLSEVNAPEPWASRLADRPEHYVSKYWLRMYPFYLNKGLTAVYDGSLRNPGEWRESWEQKWVDTDDRSYLKAIEPLARMVSVFDGAEDVAPERLIRLEPKVTALEGGDQTIFTADGAVICTEKPESEPEKTWDPSKVRPKPLRYRDVFCMLPFQIDESTLAIGVYIQTRNIADDVTDAGRYQIELPGLSADSARVYDPLNDREVDADIRTDATVSIMLTLTDCPVWITLTNADGPRGGGPTVATVGVDPYVQS